MRDNLHLFVWLLVLIVWVLFAVVVRAARRPPPVRMLGENERMRRLEEVARIASWYPGTLGELARRALETRS